MSGKWNNCNHSLKTSIKILMIEILFVKIKVHQVLYDVNENLLSDDIVYHYFTLKDGKIARFDIGDKHSSK